MTRTLWATANRLALDACRLSSTANGLALDACHPVATANGLALDVGPLWRFSPAAEAGGSRFAHRVGGGLAVVEGSRHVARALEQGALERLAVLALQLHPTSSIDEDMAWMGASPLGIGPHLAWKRLGESVVGSDSGGGGGRGCGGGGIGRIFSEPCTATVLEAGRIGLVSCGRGEQRELPGNEPSDPGAQRQECCCRREPKPPGPGAHGRPEALGGARGHLGRRRLRAGHLSRVHRGRRILEEERAGRLGRGALRGVLERLGQLLRRAAQLGAHREHAEDEGIEVRVDAGVENERRGEARPSRRQVPASSCEGSPSSGYWPVTRR
jgi:hypothetical protein